jgi:hypothetical protein
MNSGPRRCVISVATEPFGRINLCGSGFNEGGWPAPWYVFRVQPSTVFAFATAEPLGTTKFQLD